MERIGLEAVYRDAGFQAGVRDYNRKMNEAVRTSESSANLINKAFGKLVTGGALIKIGMEALQFSRDSWAAAAEFDGAMQSVSFSAAAAEREFGAAVGTAERWADQVEALSDKLTVFGKQDIAEATSRTIDMTKRLGFSEAQMTTLLERTADLSAGKVDLASGVERVTAAMRGEAESAEYLGLSLNENSVRAYAEAHGLVWKTLDEGEKAQQRYLLFLQQSAEMQGRAAEWAESGAGQVRELNVAWADFQVEFGEAMTALGGGVDPLTQFVDLFAEGAEAWQQILGEYAPAARAINEETARMALEAAIATGEVEAISAAMGEWAGTTTPALQRAMVSLTGDYDEYLELLRQGTAEYPILAAQIALTREEYYKLAAILHYISLGTDEFALAINAASFSIYHYQEAAYEAERATQDWRITVGEVKRAYGGRGIIPPNAIDTIDGAREAEEALTRSIRDHETAIRELMTTQADYLLDLQDLHEEEGRSAGDYAADTEANVNDAAQARLRAEEKLTQDLLDLEEEREYRLNEWIPSGDWERSPEEQQAARQWWIDKLQAEEDAIRQGYDSEVAAIDAGEAEKQARLDAARQAELQQQREHFEELRMLAGLGVLEANNQLGELTNGAATSAAAVADMIEAGIIPLSNELQVAIGGALQGLDEQAAESKTTQEENARIIGQLADGEYAALQLRLQTMKDAGIELGDTMPTALDNSQAAAENLAGSAENIVTSFQDVIDYLTEEGVEEGGEAGNEIGEAVVDGIAEGVRGRQDNACDAMREVIAAMLEAARQAAGAESPAKEFMPLGRDLGEGILAGVNSLARFDTQSVWDEFIRSNLSSAYTALNNVPQFSHKISSNAKWLDFVDDLGYKRYWEQAWEQLAPTLPLDTTMREVYELILERTGELAGDAWGGAFQAVNAHMNETLWDQIAGIADMTLGQYAGLTDQRIQNLFAVGGTLGSVGQAAATRWQQVGMGEAWQRLRLLERERALRADTAEIDEEIADTRQQIADAEAAIVAMNKAQQDMQWLQQQMALVEMVQKYELDRQQVLGGLTLGLGADPAAVVQAMATAMEMVVQQVQAEMQSMGVAAATGLDMMVPSGYPRDNFPVWVSSGERVIVVPQGERGPMSLTVVQHINNGMDQAESARWIRQVVADGMRI